MDQYLNKAFLIICYLYFATVWGFSLTDDYRVFILFFILLLSFVIFIEKKNNCKDRLKTYEIVGSKIFIKKTESKKSLKFVLLVFVIIYYLLFFKSRFNISSSLSSFANFS